MTWHDSVNYYMSKMEDTEVKTDSGSVGEQKI
jgi:hypothetical protein